MILKDRFLTQSAPDICCVMKIGVWTKSVSNKLLQPVQTIYYGREYEEEYKRKKESGKRLKPQQWLLDLL